jgi:hypothetical protein
MCSIELCIDPADCQAALLHNASLAEVRRVVCTSTWRVDYKAVAESVANNRRMQRVRSFSVAKIGTARGQSGLVEKHSRAALFGDTDTNASGISSVQIAPVSRPNRRLVASARVCARQRQLQTLGQRRLSRAVAAGHYGQAWPRPERERHLRTYSAEALHRDGAHVGADGF